MSGEGELKSVRKKAVLDIPSDGQADRIPAGPLCPAGWAPCAASTGPNIPKHERGGLKTSL